jgi:hypothetical protein
MGLKPKRRKRNNPPLTLASSTLHWKIRILRIKAAKHVKTQAALTVAHANNKKASLPGREDAQVAAAEEVAEEVAVADSSAAVEEADSVDSSAVGMAQGYWQGQQVRFLPEVVTKQSQPLQFFLQSQQLPHLLPPLQPLLHHQP